MALFTISLGIVIVIAILGAGIETYSPGFFSKRFKSDASAITFGFLGIVFSIVFLMIFLQVSIREGFEEQAYLTRWNAMVSATQVSEVCKLYTEIYEKTMLVEKGAPPEPLKTDAQAREAVDKQFASAMTTAPVSCSLFQEVQSKKDKLDSFFLSIQKLPDTFFAQVVETAIGSRSLLIAQYLKVQQAEKDREEEDFEDFRVCSDAAVIERKEFTKRKALSQEAQQCRLIEEVPPEKKINAVTQKLDAMGKAFQQYRLTSKVKDSIQKILGDALYYKKELYKKKQEAEDLSNKYQF